MPGMRQLLANRHLRGSGLEIGGLHNPLPVPQGVTVQYIDRMPLEDLIRTCPEVRPCALPIIVDDAETLETVAAESQDFLIANHVFEHCHDPIGTMKQWIRVLRHGGIIFAAVPEKTHTFDHKRQVTTLEHLIHDHQVGYEAEDVWHYFDWFLNVDHARVPDPYTTAQKAYAERANIHFHVWDRRAMDELLAYLAPVCRFEILEVAPNGGEVIWILQKR